MSENCLECAGLAKRFGRVDAVRDVGFTIRKGLIFALLGENGAGKTTTLKLLLGFQKKDAGEVRLNAGRIGYVPERPVFWNWARGVELLRLTARFYGLEESFLMRQARLCADRLAFDPGLLPRPVATYSLGNQKKFSYLQSLILQPDLLIVDEPFSALDPVSLKGVRDRFLELRTEGKSVLLSSHIISEVEKISDEFLIIKKGRVEIQENLRSLREKWILAGVPKSMAGRQQLLSLSPHLREQNGIYEFLLEKHRLDSLRKLFSGRPEVFGVQDVSLEQFFLFFSS